MRTRTNGEIAVALLWRAGGKQKTLTFDDYDQALRYKNMLDRVGQEQMLKVLEAETGVKQGRNEPTVEAWCRRYIANLTGVTKGTRDDYERFVRNDIAPTIGTLPLSATLDGEAIPGWVNNLSKKNAPKTVWNKHGFLHAALGSAVPKYLARNPCEETRLPQRDDAEMTFLEPEEYAALREAMAERWRPLTDFLVMSGARFGEVTALTVGDIDSVRLTCRIVRSWKYDGGVTPVLGPPKTKRSRRTINIPPEAVEGLDLDRPKSELLFHTVAGPQAPVRRRLYRQAWTRTLAKMTQSGDIEKLNGKVPRPHDLRHTCVSWMLGGSVHFKAIQEHLGHESITTTLDRYGHLDREAGVRAAAAISVAFSRGQ